MFCYKFQFHLIDVFLSLTCVLSEQTVQAIPWHFIRFFTVWQSTCLPTSRMERVKLLFETYDFQQYDILTSVDAGEPVQPPFKLRNSK